MTQARLLLLVLAHVVLTGLPGVAAALVAARKGAGHAAVLLAIGLAATGALAILTFWLYFAEPLIGRIFSFVVPAGSVLLTMWSLRGGRIDRRLLQQLAVPLALWALGSVFLVFLGFMHGGTDQPLWTAATRFRAQLPFDNDIPHFFTDWFYVHGHMGRPPVFPGGWSASDRPPLQIGYTLMQRPFAWDARLVSYQLLGVVLQQLWIVGVWVLLLAARVSRATRALTVVMILVSDLAIVNGFFIWPKMLPAAMLVAATGLVATPLWPELRRKPWAAALIATLLALALLGHGSSLFGIIPLAGLAARRGIPGSRWLAVGLVVGLALLVPWSMYQRYADPPGNRLSKEAFAGVFSVDSRSTLRAVVDAYGQVGVGGALHDKAENFVLMMGGGPMVDDIESAVDATQHGHLGVALNHVRDVFFYYLVPAFGLLVVVPILMLAAVRRRSLQRP